MSKKRIFISFAIEDANLRDLLVGQVKNENSPFEFVDMSAFFVFLVTIISMPSQFLLS